MLRLAQLSDTHLVADPAGMVWGHDSAANLASVVESFSRRPDAVVVTGDLSEDGSVEAYRRVQAITASLADEVHYVPGNHDDRANMAEVLGTGEVVRAVALSSDWTLVLLDSQWPGHDAGRIEVDSLESLDAALARSTNHVVVGLHHPPRSTCAAEYCSIVNADALLEVLAGTGTCAPCCRDTSTTASRSRTTGSSSSARRRRCGSSSTASRTSRRRARRRPHGCWNYTTTARSFRNSCVPGEAATQHTAMLRMNRG